MTALSPLQLRVVRHNDLLTLLARDFALPNASLSLDSPSDQVIAEYLRETLERLATNGGRAPSEPVHVASLTNQVRRQLRPIWPTLDKTRDRRATLSEQEAEGDTEPDPIRRVLEALQELRDIAHVGGGHWLPTPTRLVALPRERSAPGDVLIIGGRSTRDLRLAHPKISLRWIARVASADEIASDGQSGSTSWQPLEDWLGMPPESLEDWTRATLTRALESLAPSSPDVTEFQVYAPQAASRRPQALRWIDVQRLAHPPSGLLLCRTGSGHWSSGRRYWLGTVVSTRSARRAEREAEISPGDLRRLQYGLDLQAGAPTRVSIARNGGDDILSLPNFIPGEERRLLIAFGEDVSSVAGRLPLRYRFAGGVPPVVLSTLGRLGVVIDSSVMRR